MWAEPAIKEKNISYDFIFYYNNEKFNLPLDFNIKARCQVMEWDDGQHITDDITWLDSITVNDKEFNFNNDSSPFWPLYSITWELIYNIIYSIINRKLLKIDYKTIKDISTEIDKNYTQLLSVNWYMGTNNSLNNEPMNELSISFNFDIGINETEKVINKNISTKISREQIIIKIGEDVITINKDALNWLQKKITSESIDVTIDDQI